MTASSSSSADGGARAVPAGGIARGRLTPPPSKSLTHRYLALALLSGRRLVVENPLYAEDTRLFLAALERLGLTVEARPEAVTLTPPATGRRPPRAEIDCGNAGTMLRFLVAGLCVVPGRWRLDGVPRLRQRPVGPLVEALRRLGATIDYAGETGFPPLDIAGDGLAGGVTRLDAGSSSQFLSALLMAAQSAAGDVELEVPALTSAPYVELTLAAVADFGGRVERPAPGRFRVRPGPLAGPPRVRVEGDFSAVCYPAAAAALSGGPVTVAGIRAASRQGDRGFLDLLARMGAEVAWGDGEVTVRGGRLRAVDADLAAMPDQVPTLAALAPFAEGTTRITGVPHLRIKESDRLAAMAGELGRLGVPAIELADGLEIPGVWAGRRPPADPVTVDPHGDHRIAMSLALTALRRPGVSIAHPEVVAKSYPAFWQDLELLLGV